MIRLIKTEFLKYKRYNIVWLGIVSIFFSIILAVFQLTGTKNSIVSYAGLSEGVIWNHFSLFLPFTFVLVVGYSINREYTDFTLKNILVIPVSRIRLIMSKIIVGYGLVIIEWIFSSVITLLIALFMGCEDINIASCAISFKQLFIVSTCCYIAVLPIIIITAGKQNRFLSGVIFSFFYGFCGIFLADRNLVNLYPMTTGLVLSNYAHDDTFIHKGKLVFSHEKDDLIDNYGIANCKAAVFDAMDKSQIIAYRKEDYQYKVLVRNRHTITKKNPDVIVGPATIEEIMLFYVKGEMK